MDGNELRCESLKLMMGAEEVVLVVAAATGDIEIPDGVANDAGTVVLNVGWNLINPIRELQLDKLGLSGIFSFNREPAKVFIPWENMLMYSFVDGDLAPRAGEKIAWPYEITPQMEEDPPEATPTGGHLKVVN